MTRLLCGLALALMASVASAQTLTERGTGAILRVLDKVSGDVTDLSLANGGQTEIERLVVRLGECRFPPENAQGEAYAWLDVTYAGDAVFSGWMIASSPALSAMDHARFDVWVLRCSNS